MLYIINFYPCKVGVLTTRQRDLWAQTFEILSGNKHNQDLLEELRFVCYDFALRQIVERRYLSAPDFVSEMQ